MKPQNLLPLLSLILLAGCAILPVKEECASGFMMSGDDCIPIVRDAGGDGGQDMAMSDDLGVDEGTPDAGPCGMPCTAPTLLCNATSGECVQCTAADATACGGATPVCDTTAGACVACNVSSDCASLTAPQCNAATHVCEACTADAACMGRATTTACDVTGGGDCVACTAGNEAACGMSSCNPATNSCTTTARTTIRTCRACVADSECMADNRCVSMNFMGTARADGYCLKRFSTGCARPYTVTTAARVSLSAALVETYCGVDEASTTCEAVLALVDDAACAASTDTDCGVTGLADGLCRTVSGVMNRCTYACTTAAQCPGAVTCMSGYCGS